MRHPSNPPVACTNCAVQTLCLPGFNEQELGQIEQIVSVRRKVRQGAHLVRAGDPFNGLFAIQSGSLKTCVSNSLGQRQITGFHLAGDSIGFDGVGTGHHVSDALALDDATVCVLPFDRIEALSRSVRSVQHHVHHAMAREIERTCDHMVLLGTRRADERLAAFLCDLLQRLHRRGGSATDCDLGMTREDIGSYLGLQPETVARTLSRWADENMVEVRYRHIRIVDASALERLAGRREEVGAVTAGVPLLPLFQRDATAALPAL